MKGLLIFCCLAPLFALGGCCNPPNSAMVNVPITAQEQSNWCWAASGKMCMNYIHPASNITECDEANKEFSQTTCCANGSSSQCNNGGWPQPDKYGFTFNTTSNAPLTFAEIQGQISCSAKPFAFSWHWSGGGGHMMVVVGYNTVDSVNYVTVNDPLPVGVGSQWTNTYDYYVAATGHTHWNDYYNITYTGGN